MKRYDAMQNVLLQPNARTLGVMKLIDSYYPAFAKKVFDRNPLMEKLAMANFTSMDILLYPICGHCETLAAFSSTVKKGDGTPLLKPNGLPIAICTCFKCGRTTIDPITFRDWCLLELKKRAPEDIGESLDSAVDLIAEKCVADAERIYMKAKKKENNNEAPQ